MKQINLLALFTVVLLISIDISFSISHANSLKKQEKFTIYKVNKVSPLGTLKMRAWPSTKSRIKVSLPHNAKDLVETGKQRKINNSTWLQVKWKENTGWVNSYYLAKTGVLLESTPKISSRNTRQTPKQIAINSKKIELNSDTSPENGNLPNEYQGDRYDQSLATQPENQNAFSNKIAYSEHNTKDSKRWILDCTGSTPTHWNIKMDVTDKSMFVKLADKKGFNVPITYRKWAPGGQVRMEIGGGKGRNVVDATLEKTFACNTGLSKTNYSYMVNAAVNRGELLSGCCQPAAK